MQSRRRAEVPYEPFFVLLIPVIVPTNYFFKLYAVAMALTEHCEYRMWFKVYLQAIRCGYGLG